MGEEHKLLLEEGKYKIYLGEPHQYILFEEKYSRKKDKYYTIKHGYYLKLYGAIEKIINLKIIEKQKVYEIKDYYNEIRKEIKSISEKENLKKLDELANTISNLKEKMKNMSIKISYLKKKTKK